MLAHVYQFGTFGSTAPWVYAGIAFGLCLITAVNVYRILRKKRARRRHKEPPAGVRYPAPVDRCGRPVCVKDAAFPPADCPLFIRAQCPDYCPF